MLLRSYRLQALVFALVSVPGWIGLATGQLMNQRYPFSLLSFLAVPLAVLFLLFGTGLRQPNGRSWIALRTGAVSLAFVVILLVSLGGVAAGAELLMTSVLFCATAASFVGVLTLVFLLGASVGRQERAPGANPPEAGS